MSSQYKKASIATQDAWGLHGEILPLCQPWIHAPVCLASHFLVQHLLFYLAGCSSKDRGTVVFPRC